jgi:hypothetical protein
MTTPHRVRAVTDEEIAQVVREVREDGEARVIEKDGEAIAVVIGPAEYAELLAGGHGLPRDHDPEGLRRVLRSMQGLLDGVDTEALKRAILDAREQAGREYSAN